MLFGLVTKNSDNFVAQLLHVSNPAVVSVVFFYLVPHLLLFPLLPHACVFLEDNPKPHLLHQL